MSVVGVVELLAWLLSAVIAAWLVTDLVKVSRTYRGDALINREDLTDGALGATPSADDPKGNPA